MMYIKINRKKIKIIEANTVWKYIKGLKFVFRPIDYGIRFSKKRIITTNFLCQKIDIINTDINNKVLYIYKAVGSERCFFLKASVYYTYFLPIGSASNVKLGDTIKVFIEKKQKRD